VDSNLKKPLVETTSKSGGKRESTGRFPPIVASDYDRRKTSDISSGIKARSGV
jgi:hypothetical protein